jgi:hypothetical protein
LRGDLAKLDDAEIVAEMNRLLEERQALYDSMSPLLTSPVSWAFAFERWLYRLGLTFWFGRGPIHARIVYKIRGFWFGPSNSNPFGTLFCYDCEIKDVRDEIERRVKQRRRQSHDQHP